MNSSRPALSRRRGWPSGATGRTLGGTTLTVSTDSDDPRRWRMFGRGAQVPELVPQLSRGRHRSPRSGACFMEMASFLAGERWSDHPACTHPLLAALARLVNDHTSDAGRGRLVELIPSVVGLTSDDPHVDLEIMLRASTTALPVASAPRQRVLAVAVLSGERA